MCVYQDDENVTETADGHDDEMQVIYTCQLRRDMICTIRYKNMCCTLCNTKDRVHSAIIN